MSKVHVIALYGLSSSTQELLEQIGNKFNVVGLLDGYRQDGVLYDKPIISMEQAIQSGVEAIVVVARPGSRRIIVNRICEACEQNNIGLYDVHGKDLLAPRQESGKIHLENSISRKELQEKIDQCEVVSFDIFDTLITRAVMYPADVFALVEQKLWAKYKQGFDFCKKRQEVEHELSLKGVPNIDDIYRELEGRMPLSKEELAEVKEWEWETEFKVILPRYDMCEMFRYALSGGKKVYLVSDMYYSKVQLDELLAKWEITGYEDLLVSCEHQTTKRKQLFQVLKERAKDCKCVHIGDNYVADVKNADDNGITGVWIRSGLELFDAMHWSERFARFESLAERIKLGMFIARMFNSPFQLEKGILKIEHPQNLGYLLFAPVLTDYTLWMYEQLKNAEKTTVLFGARDGYLIKEMFDKVLRQKGAESSLQTVYFLISRVSVVCASLFEKSDVLRVASMDYSASFGQMLQARFSLKEEEIFKKDFDAVPEEAIHKYVASILERAEEGRKNYLRYIGQLGAEAGQIVFFDFVSSGTCQAALEKIMKKKMKGYYFIRVEDKDFEKKQLQILPFYGKEENVGESKIYEEYFVLENILTSPMPSLKGFDANGKPEYLKEYRSVEEIEFIRKVHEGIVEYLERYQEILGTNCGADSRKCSEEMLDLIHTIPIENPIFNQMIWEDDFYSRTIGMKDLM